MFNKYNKLAIFLDKKYFINVQVALKIDSFDIYTYQIEK